MTAPPPAAAPASASLVEDFIDIFTSPAEVFQRRMGKGAPVPYVIIIVVALALIFLTRGVFQPAMDAEFQRATARAMAQNPQITAAQMEQGRAFFEKFGAIFFWITIALSIPLTGVFLWLVGKMFKATQTVGDSVMVATYAWIPRVLGMIVVAVIAALMDPAKMNGMMAASLSVAHLLDPDTTSQKLMVIAGRVDVFMIWQTILLGIGLSITGKIPRAQAYVAAGVMWVIGTLTLMLLQR